MTYNRPWKSFDDQLALLEQRGMIIGDRAAARAYLERIGYYRLSAYWYPFRQFTIRQDAQTRNRMLARAIPEQGSTKTVHEQPAA